MDENTTPKKPNLLLRLLTFLVTLALVVGAIFLVANRDRLNLDALKRYFTYRSLERNDSGQAESFPYSSSSSDIFALLGEDLLVCSAGGVRLYSGGGVCYIEQAIPLDQPAVEIGGDTAAVWSVGANSIYIYRDRVEYGTLENLDGSILSVRLNSSGWMAVLTRESGYRAVVTVYNRELKKLMSFRLSSNFVTDAVVSKDCKSLMVVGIGQESTAFESTLTLYPLASSEAGVHYDLASTESWPLGNNVILELRENGNIWCMGDAGVSTLVGNTLSSWSCADLYLKGYDLGENFAAMLVGKYRAGSQAELYTIDTAGQPSTGLAINEQTLSLSAAGRYVALLSADGLSIYTQNLELYNTLEDTDGARQVLMRADGTALLIGTDTARLYVPD